MTKSTPKTTISKKTAQKAATVKAKIKAPVKLRTVKKATTAKVPAVKKSPGPKTITPKRTKVVAKKAVTKKAMAPKTVIQKAVLSKSAPRKASPKVKTPAKAATHKANIKKAAVKTTRPSTKDDLRKNITSLETRMKRADSLTRKSVKALETAVLTLDARTRKDNSTGKAALTRKVNQLSAKLTDLVAKTQAEVNSELKTALNDPSVENLQAALFRADQRMSDAEQAQAAAISKVNRHLSAIATTVDARIENEAKARQAAIAALQAEAQYGRDTLTTRIDTIETDTAQALSRAGDKIAELSEELSRRGEASEISIREKVSEIALQTQTEFENYRAGLERRIDDVAYNAENSNTHQLEHSIASLTARIEGLEYAVSNPPMAEMPAQMAVPSAPQLSVVSSQPIPLVASPQFLNEAQVPDAFSPAPHTAEMATPAIPNPYLTGQLDRQSASGVAQESHVPVEFDPNSFVKPQQTDEPLRDFTQPQISQIAPPPEDLTTLPPIKTDGQAIPYADPAYAESDPTMARVRIGESNDPKFNLPKLTGRNLRVAALATGVAVVGLVAAKGVFGNSNSSDTLPQQTVEKTNAQNNITPVSIPKPDTSIAPIGDYADNKAVEVPPRSDAAKTLNSAASSGDSVAQFQLGLSYLEQGRTDEGVSLIRKSANQNQPAAQYRLAKLYEIGEGVSQDSEMARQLTERAARNGNRIAMHDLALYYAEGRGGVEADLPIAASWFEKAAERGVVDSQFNLGVLFESGQGLPKNVNDAFVWYSIAAKQGDQFAKTRVEVLTGTLDQTDLVTAAARAEKFKPVKIDNAANGIFRNVAWSQPADKTGQKITQVRQAQTMLTELGYEIGGADGSIGPKTRAAIINFERANSLPETGRVNTALIDRLELATGA